MSSSLETMSCADIMMYMNQKEDNDKAKAAAEAKELFATIKHVLINPFVNDLVAGRSVETTKTAREIQMQWYDTVFNLICRGNKTLARAVFTEYGWFVETFALESAVQVLAAAEIADAKNEPISESFLKALKKSWDTHERVISQLFKIFQSLDNCDLSKFDYQYTRTNFKYYKHFVTIKDYAGLRKEGLEIWKFAVLDVFLPKLRVVWQHIKKLKSFTDEQLVLIKDYNRLADAIVNQKIASRKDLWW